MTFDYKNTLTFPVYISQENIKSNFSNKFESTNNATQKNKKPGLFGRDVTNTVVKNNNINNLMFKSRFNFDAKPVKNKIANEKSDDSDYLDDSSEVDSDEINSNLASFKLNKIPSRNFEADSVYASSSIESPNSSDNQENENSSGSLTLMEQNSSSDEYSSMEWGNSSSSAASSSVKTNRVERSTSYPLGSPTKYASYSCYDTPVSKKRTIHDLDINPSDSSSSLTPLKKIAYDNSSSSTNPRVPEAPSKIRPLKPNTFAYKAMELTKQDVFRFESGNRSVKFQIGGNPIGKGCYCEVFEIVSSDGELVPGYSNEQILFKRYYKGIIEKRRENVEKFMDRSLEQYNLLSEAYLGEDKFPIVKIFNAKPAKEDGYVLVKRVPYEYNDGMIIDMRDQDTLNRLDQVRAMFKYAFDEGIALDLSRDNVRVNENGKVILIDFMEESQGKFKYLIEKHIESFAKGNEEIKEYLRPKGYVKLG